MNNRYRIITGLILIILIILSVLLYLRFFTKDILFTLFGPSEVTIYENNKYVEYGFIAKDNKGNNLNNKVSIKTNLNINKQGKYEIKYLLRSGFKLYKCVRYINVIKDVIPTVSFELKGSSVINLSMGKNYKDPKFICKLKATGKDLSHFVLIESNLNNKKEGKYEVKYILKYQGKEKVLTRKIYVLPYTASYSINTTKLTNKPVTIKFNSYIYNFAYVICPNENIIYKNEFTYNFYLNGVYDFYIFDSLNNYEVFTITINNIDMIPPKGNCNILMKNGTTKYDVKTNDKDILKYLYNGEERFASSNNTFLINTYLRNNVVILIDKAGNKTKLNCKLTKVVKPIIKSSITDNVVFDEKSDSLAINIVKKDGYYLTRLWLKDPFVQTNKEILNKNDNRLQYPKTFLERAIRSKNIKNKIVIGGSGSASVLKGSYYNDLTQYDKKYNLKEPSALLVNNYKVIFNDYQKYPISTHIYYINGRNELKSIPPLASYSSNERKEIFEKALYDGIKETFAFRPLLVKDYKVQNTGNDYYALRNGFGQIDENNFIWIMSETKKWYLQDFAKFMQGLNVKTAVNFDGGGSVALLYKPKNTRKIKTLTGNNRKLTSAIYFTELD